MVWRSQRSRAVGPDSLPGEPEQDDGRLSGLTPVPHHPNQRLLQQLSRAWSTDIPGNADHPSDLLTLTCQQRRSAKSVRVAGREKKAKAKAWFVIMLPKVVQSFYPCLVYLLSCILCVTCNHSHQVPSFAQKAVSISSCPFRMQFLLLETGDERKLDDGEKKAETIKIYIFRLFFSLYGRNVSVTKVNNK